MSGEFLYWDYEQRGFYRLKDYTKEELYEMFKSRYTKCVKEFRINKLLHAVSTEILKELKERGEDTDDLTEFAEEVQKEEYDEIDRQLEIMYAQVEPDEEPY
jgi:hypothetical protein